MNISALQSMSHGDLIALLSDVMYCHHTGYLLGSAAVHLITPKRNECLVYIDMCQVHMLNHEGSVDRTNGLWLKAFGRAGDNPVKVGGDEFAILVNLSDVGGYIRRLTEAMKHVGIYAVIVVLKPSDSPLARQLVVADDILSAAKLSMDRAGRNDDYVCGECVVIGE